MAARADLGDITQLGLQRGRNDNAVEARVATKVSRWRPLGGTLQNTAGATTTMKRRSREQRTRRTSRLVMSRLVGLAQNAGLFLRFAPALVGGGADDDAARRGCATIQQSAYTHSIDVGNPASTCFQNASVEQVPPFDTHVRGKRQWSRTPSTVEKKSRGTATPRTIHESMSNRLQSTRKVSSTSRLSLTHRGGERCHGAQTQHNTEQTYTTIKTSTVSVQQTMERNNKRKEVQSIHGGSIEQLPLRVALPQKAYGRPQAARLHPPIPRSTSAPHLYASPPRPTSSPHFHPPSPPPISTPHLHLQSSTRRSRNHHRRRSVNPPIRRPQSLGKFFGKRLTILLWMRFPYGDALSAGKCGRMASHSCSSCGDSATSSARCTG